MIKSLLTFCVITMLLVIPVRAGWVVPEGGQIPSQTVLAGQDRNGLPIYACRAEHGGGIYPGTLMGPSPNCSISYDGNQYSLSYYEILVGSGYSWVKAFNGDIPFDALPAGKERQGELIYICRGEVNSEWRVGKIRHSGLCIIPYRGKEFKAPWYEVLVGN